MQNFFGLRGTADFDPFFSRLGRGFEWPIPSMPAWSVTQGFAGYTEPVFSVSCLSGGQWWQRWDPHGSMSAWACPSYRASSVVHQQAGGGGQAEVQADFALRGAWGNVQRHFASWNWKVLPASSGWRPVTLLNTPRCTGGVWPKRQWCWNAAPVLNLQKPAPPSPLGLGP